MFQREFRERIQQQKFAQNKLREQRQQFARANKYYSIYHVQLRARLMQEKTQEERVSVQNPAVLLMLTLFILSGFPWILKFKKSNLRLFKIF